MSSCRQNWCGPERSSSPTNGDVTCCSLAGPTPSAQTDESSPQMKIAILWKGPSGYMNASVDALSRRLGNDLLYLVYGSHSAAPYANELPEHRPAFVLNRDSEPVAKYLDDFQPDVLLVSSWDAPEFMKSQSTPPRSVPRSPVSFSAISASP